jgi:hypothetical protein
MAEIEGCQGWPHGMTHIQRLETDPEYAHDPFPRRGKIGPVFVAYLRSSDSAPIRSNSLLKNPLATEGLDDSLYRWR